MLRIAVVLLFLLPVSRAQGSGFSFEPCLIDSNCQAPRTCNTTSDATAPCRPGVSCFCVPPQTQICNNPSQCPAGETCFALETTYPLCGSVALVQNFRAAKIITEPIGNGLTFDQCTENSDCFPNRSCIVVGENIQDFLPCNGNPFCVCLPPLIEIVICIGDSDCMPGEVCVSVTGVDGKLCISPFAAIRIPTTSRVEPPIPDGLTQDPCQFSTECKTPRGCVSSTDFRACIDRRDCRCFQDRFCGTREQCEDGEVCARFDTLQQCMSEAFVDATSNVVEVNDPSVTATTRPKPSSGDLDAVQGTIPVAIGRQPDIPGLGSSSPTPPQPSGGCACIDTIHLKDLPREQRWSQLDVVSTVLCDRDGSCATPGHLVVYQERAMMMRSYCERVGCVEEIRHVNSPKFSRGWRGNSFTSGLEFTALAARYETKTEEILLQAAVRFGV